MTKITTSRPTKRLNQHSYAHKMVADLQIKMAHAVYEERASKDNDFYREWPSATRFVNAVAPLLRDQARAVLADMLTRPDVSDEDKAEIHEALVLDWQIPNEDRIPLTIH